MCAILENKLNVLCWIFFCSYKVSGCTSITTKYVIPGNNVTLQFQARTVNSLDSSVVVTNQILSNKNFPLLSALYKNGANTFISACNNCTFTGNAETGDLSIRLYNLQKSDGGRYKHSVTQGIQQLEGCVDVYILDKITTTTAISTTWGHGILKQIYIKDNKVPVKGGEIQIGCDIVHFSDADTVRVYKTDSILTSDLTTAQSLANCYPTSCFGTQPRHKFSSSNSGVTIKITNLDSSDDKKYWTCVMNNQQMYMQLTVYYFRSDMYTSTTKTNYTMAIIIGAVCIAVLIYATGVTIMYKRTTKKEGTTSNSANGTYVRETLGNISDVRMAQHDANESTSLPSPLYTELAHYSNERTTYERLQN